MGIDGLTATQKSIGLCIAGFVLFIAPLSLKVDRFTQVLCYIASGMSFASVLSISPDAAYEGKLKRQNQMKRDMVTAARFEAAEGYEVQQVQQEFRMLKPATEPVLSAPLPGTEASLQNAGEKLAKVLEHCGENAIELIDYLWDGRAESISDDNGWINVRQLRKNWGEYRGYKAETFLSLLQKLTELEVGEFRNLDYKEWRLLLVV